MADGDNEKPSPSNLISSELLPRFVGGKGNPPSYFFQQQVQRCYTEQSKILDFQLSEKEKEAHISYEKPITGLFGVAPQIESTFAKIIFDSKAAVNLDGLVEELRTLACGDEKKQNEQEDPIALTRLLDLLFVLRRNSQLKEELEIRGAHYDLYNPEAKGKFDTMAALPGLMSKAKLANYSKRSDDLSLYFSLLATGQDELISTVLVYLAKVLRLPWDALVLARHFYGANHEVTKMLHTIWADVVMNDEKFKMINIMCSLDSRDLLDVARGVMTLATSKKHDPLIQAYRCLAIFLSMNSTQQPDLKIKLKMAEAARVMCDVFTTVLGFGRTEWARCMLDDLSKRAPPGEIPSDICKIGLTCLVELNELILKTQTTEPYRNDELEKLALKWREKINKGQEGMDKLKTETPDSQKVVYSWLHRLSDVLSKPLYEEVPINTLTPKMECSLLAVEFLHEMIRWAVVGKEGEQLKLKWPVKLTMSITIHDKSIVVGGSPRGRSMSIASTRSVASVAKDDSKLQPQQRNRGDAKEENHNMQRSVPNQHQGQESRAPPHSMPRNSDIPPSQKPGAHVIAGPFRGGQGSIPSNGTEQWARGQNRSVTAPMAQDIRKQNVASGDNSGESTPGKGRGRGKGPFSGKNGRKH